MSTAAMQKKSHKKHKQHISAHQQQQPEDYADGTMLTFAMVMIGIPLQLAKIHPGK